MKEVKLNFHYTSAYCNRENSIPVFLRCRGVKGNLKIDNDSKRDVDKVKIVLTGILVNCLAHYNDCCEQFTPHRLVVKEQVLNLVEAHDWPSDDSSDSEGNSASFSFDFPLYRKPWQTQQDFVSSTGTIPSSLSVAGYACKSSQNHFSCSATSQIRYELQAFAYERDELVEKITSSVTIYDTENPHPPPIHEAHFQGEYVCRVEKHLKKLGMKSAKLSISAAEPKPLEIQAKSGVTLAAVAIKLTLQTSKSKSKAPPLDVRSQSMLKTSTYLSVGKMLAHPTAVTCRTSPLVSAHQRYAGRRVRNLMVDDWVQEGVGQWTREMVILLPVAENTFPAPSFFTPYVTRRYSLALKLDVKCSWGDAKFRLDVPVQIVYPENCIDYAQINNPYLIEETMSDDDELPIYIR